MIWQIRNSIVAMLLVAVFALAASLLATSSLATSSPATSSSATTRPKDVVPSCAPLPDAPAKPKSKAVTNTPRPAAAAPGKSGAKASNDDDDDFDDDDKDFPPLKPGESFHLIGFAIDGSKHIDEDALIATLPERVGDPITDAQIKANTAKIKKALTDRHVHFADVTTALVQRAGPDHCMWVIWGIQHVDAFSKLQYQGFWKFGGQTFTGNKALGKEQLEKAIDLKIGERVREGAVSDAITGIQQAYDRVFPGQTVKVKGKLKLKVKPERVANFEWEIIEPPAK